MADDALTAIALASVVQCLQEELQIAKEKTVDEVWSVALLHRSMDIESALFFNHAAAKAYALSFSERAFIVTTTLAGFIKCQQEARAKIVHLLPDTELNCDFWDRRFQSFSTLQITRRQLLMGPNEVETVPTSMTK